MGAENSSDAVRPISQAEYVKALRPLLPPEAFAPDPRKTWLIAAHLAVVGGGYAAIRFSSSPILYFLCTLIIGHSLGCIAFLAHALSHNAIIRHRRWKCGLELLLWGLNVFSPTLWNRVHNQTHHLQPNGLGDTDRRYIKGEVPKEFRWLIRISYPSKQVIRWLPTVFFSFTTYIVLYAVTTFYRVDIRPATKPAFIADDKFLIACELLVICLMQIGIFFAVGGQWLSYLFAGPFAFLISSSVIMAYILTNHFIKPLCEGNDPLAASTSVLVPGLFNRLHLNFSYHTEHHVFPSINSDYYPLVSELLKERYSDRYNQVPFGEAWRQLWQHEEFLDLIETHPVAGSAEPNSQPTRIINRGLILPVGGEGNL
jgi:fatty acid desaturase